MVLFLYVIMLLNLNQESEPHKRDLVKVAAVICAGTMMIVLVGALKGTSTTAPITGGEIGLVKNLGKVLFDEFLLPFEVSSILLLAAMVGVIMIGKQDHRVATGNESTTESKSSTNS